MLVFVVFTVDDALVCCGSFSSIDDAFVGDVFFKIDGLSDAGGVSVDEPAALFSRLILSISSSDCCLAVLGRVGVVTGGAGGCFVCVTTGAGGFGCSFFSRGPLSASWILFIARGESKILKIPLSGPLATSSVVVTLSFSFSAFTVRDSVSSSSS